MGDISYRNFSRILCSCPNRIAIGSVTKMLLVRKITTKITRNKSSYPGGLIFTKTPAILAHQTSLSRSLNYNPHERNIFSPLRPFYWFLINPRNVICSTKSAAFSNQPDLVVRAVSLRLSICRPAVDRLVSFLPLSYFYVTVRLRECTSRPLWDDSTPWKHVRGRWDLTQKKKLHFQKCLCFLSSDKIRKGEDEKEAGFETVFMAIKLS